MVTVEVPEGCKFCKGCGGVFPKESHFSRDREYLKRSGEVVMHYRPECKECQWARRRGAVAPAVKVHPEESLDAIAERINDDISCGEQLVYRKGGRISWSRYNGTVPAGVELLGRFNAGADWRDLRGSLEA